MCKTKRIAWRPEVPEHAQMGLLGGMKANFGFLGGPRPSGNRKKNDLEQKTFLRKTRFFLPQIWPFCTQNGPKWGPLGGLGG